MTFVSIDHSHIPHVSPGESGRSLITVIMLWVREGLVKSGCYLAHLEFVGGFGQGVFECKKAHSEPVEGRLTMARMRQRVNAAEYSL